MIIGLKELAQGVDRIRVRTETAEKVDEVLVPHARQDHVERARLQSRIDGARQTAASGVLWSVRKQRS
jgi:hypothetical protein